LCLLQKIPLPLFAKRNADSGIEDVLHKRSLNACSRVYVFFRLWMNSSIMRTSLNFWNKMHRWSEVLSNRQRDFTEYVSISERSRHIWYVWMRTALVESYGHSKEFFHKENLKRFDTACCKWVIKWPQDTFVLNKEAHFLINCSFLLAFSHALFNSELTHR
jgi:hypothetical protein